MDILAVILGRKGSKRVPNKNNIQLLDKPILAYTIAHLQESKLITRVVINTDDEQLESTAKSFGIEATPRPPETADLFSCKFLNLKNG